LVARDPGQMAYQDQSDQVQGREVRGDVLHRVRLPQLSGRSRDRKVIQDEGGFLP
jgi:hypothetical protein